MPLLSIAEQIALARRHDFTDAEIPDVCAVIMTESGGDTRAVQRNGLGRGLVQIDLGQHPTVTEAQAFDQDFAMAFARRLSRNASGLGPTNWYGPRDHPEVAAKARSAARALLAQEGPSMKFVTRSEWGARSASTSTNITPDGVAIHWEGPGMGTFPHSACAGRVRSIQAYHMDTNGWADIAYSAVACPHGYIFEGRGPGHRTAANGTDDGNQRYYAVCYLGGEGDPFTDEAKRGINDAIDWLGGGEIVGHRDLTSTACPGGEIYVWVLAGHPSPGGTAPPAQPPPTEEELTMIVFDGPPARGGGVWKSDGVFRNRINAGETWPALEKAGAKHIGVAPIGLFDDLVDVDELRASGNAGGVDLSSIADRVAARVADLIRDRLAN